MPPATFTGTRCRVARMHYTKTIPTLENLMDRLDKQDNEIAALKNQITKHKDTAPLSLGAHFEGGLFG